MTKAKPWSVSSPIACCDNWGCTPIKGDYGKKPAVKKKMTVDFLF